MAKSVFYIPNGPKNLKSIFPDVDFHNMAEYYLEVLDVNGDVVGTTTVNAVGCCCPEDKVRIHFLNNTGTYDAVNFGNVKVIRENDSDEYKNSLSYPLSKTDTGTERFNVVSNETYECIHFCKESELPWLLECTDSPKAFMEWKGIEGQADSYLPIVILNSKQDRKKTVNEYEHLIVLQFKLSNEYQTIRN